MAAIAVTTEGFEQVFAFTDRLENPKWDRLLTLIGMTVEEQTINHFRQQGGPEGPWAARKDSNPWPILIRRGGAGLMGSIGFAPAFDYVAIGTDLFYGKFHQEGTSKMVARKFLGLTETDKEELKSVIETYIQSVVSGL